MSVATKIGRVASINGNKITIRLEDNVKSVMPIIEGVVYKIGQIGSFLKIPLGYINLYGVVTQIGADAMPESYKGLEIFEKNKAAFNARWISMIMIGECISNRFERGVTQFPTAEDEVHLVTVEDLSVIYGGLSDDSSIVVGNISVSESLPAKLDINKMVTRHCAIVGATGSGKSNATAVLIEAIAKGIYKSARILIIDPHGEYNDTLKDYSKVFKINADSHKQQEELNIPFWALPFNELMEIFPGNLSDQNRDYLRSKMLEYRIAAINQLNEKPPIQAVTADSPIPFSIKDLWFELDDFERITYSDTNRSIKTTLQQTGNAQNLQSNIYQPATTTNSAPFINNKAKGILGFLDGIKNRLIDKRFNFLFEPGSYNPNSIGKVIEDLPSLLSLWMGHYNGLVF